MAEFKVYYNKKMLRSYFDFVEKARKDFEEKKRWDFYEKQQKKLIKEYKREGSTEGWDK